MQISVNGESRDVAPGASLQALLDAMEINCEALVVQRNDDIVARQDFPTTELADGDVLELIRFVGGG